MDKKENILIHNASNLFYLTKMDNPDAFLFIGENEKYYFTDSRYIEQAQQSLKDCILMQVSGLFDFIKTKGIKDLGIEIDLPFGIYEKLCNCGVETFFKVSEYFLNQRASKDKDELEKIKKAQAITDKTFEDIPSVLKEGMTEKELANILESKLFLNGADELAFKSIVAFNENSSKPHAERTEKRLSNNSIITLDFGARVDNYDSDMTRTIFFGEPNNEWLKIYNIVLSTQEKVIEKLYYGITGKEVNDNTMEEFEKYGLSKYFLHSTGHGVGIDIHENPTLSKKNTCVLPDKCVFTIEPGLYFENDFGVRIEDMIFFDKNGIINLTKSPKNIIIV